MSSRDNLQIVWCLWTGALVVAAALACAAPVRAAGEMSAGPKSGLPVPRFVSLKPDRVNVRGGPTRDHEVTFVYTRSGLPVEITAESDNWRRIRDWEGSEGWVYHSLLSGRRTAVATPKDKNQLVPLYDAGDSNAAVIARLQAGVLASVKRCTGTGAAWLDPASMAGWCRNSYGASIRTRKWNSSPVALESSRQYALVRLVRRHRSIGSA
jgi:SH3-like domain-containing protein